MGPEMVPLVLTHIHLLVAEQDPMHIYALPALFTASIPPGRKGLSSRMLEQQESLIKRRWTGCWQSEEQVSAQVTKNPQRVPRYLLRSYLDIFAPQKPSSEATCTRISKLETTELSQGSLHYTPEHCLAKGGFPVFRWKKACFKWATWISFKEPCLSKDLMGKLVFQVSSYHAQSLPFFW